MSGCNRVVSFQFKDYERYGFDNMPKGDYLRIAANPYNGRIVFQFNDSVLYQDAIIEMLEGMIEEFYLLRRKRIGKAVYLSDYADYQEGKIALDPARIYDITDIGEFDENIFVTCDLPA